MLILGGFITATSAALRITAEVLLGRDDERKCGGGFCHRGSFPMETDDRRGGRTGRVKDRKSQIALSKARGEDTTAPGY